MHCCQAREVRAVMEPQEIEDEEHEQILERVAAVDVAKASGMVCTRVPDPARPGRRRTRVWQVDATTNAPDPQSGARSRSGRTGKGNPYAKGILGEAAAAAARTDTFLGQRYRRPVRRIGKLKALVAIARSILVIVWHLLADRSARYHDLGSDFYDERIDKARKTRSHIRQLEALGYTVTLTNAA